MMFGASLRTERLLRAQRCHVASLGLPVSLPVISKHVRFFSDGSGPTDENSRNANLESTSKGLRRESPRQTTWGNEIHHLRPPRFGPKSQKNFQAAASPTRKYGIRDLELKLIKDSSNVPILIPGRVLKADGTNEEITTHKTEGDTRGVDKSGDIGGTQPRQLRRRRKLPMVNASALLDKSMYCKKSAFPCGITTKSGTEAAKRLLRGKKELLDMIRGNIIYQQTQRPFCLAGHGIPKQLLQDHLNMADGILRNFNEPAECALNSNSMDPSFPETMTIRGKEGQYRNWAWPPQLQPDRSPIVADPGFGPGLSQGNEHSLILYLAAMDRISRQLGPVGSSLNKESKKKWIVKMCRGMAYPLEVISRPDDEEDGRPVPILEWSMINNANNSRPHVSIRLQGTPIIGVTEDEAPLRNPVTLIYHAIFTEDPRVEPRAAPL